MIVEVNKATIASAAQTIRDGGLVAFPTETVYGLAADATNGKAVVRIFEAKGRPRFNPLIVHVADSDEARKYAEFNPLADMLAARFWPGGLTLVLPLFKGANKLSSLVTAGLDTVAIRVPSHPVAQALLRVAETPIAAPSANISGRVSATEAAHVHEDFGDRVGLILDGGRTNAGLESTIVSLVDAPTLLRTGAISREEIETALGTSLLAHESGQIQAPGQLASHYAPRARLRMNATDTAPGELLLGFGAAASNATLNLSATGDLIEAAANLFASLRELDARQPPGIAVMPIPEIGLGEAINDRLRRASAPRQ